MVSRFAFVSRSVAPSGAMSRSWKQKKGICSFVVSSKTPRIFISAISISSESSSQGRIAVPTPKGSLIVAFIVCQNAMEKRRWSFIFLPPTCSSGL